jgi:hypothetical protein
MMILTIVMFGISATYFALDIYSVANGLFHPKKYPKTVINLWGPETTAQVILRGTSVGHFCGLSYSSQKIISFRLFWATPLSFGELGLHGVVSFACSLLRLLSFWALAVRSNCFLCPHKFSTVTDFSLVSFFGMAFAQHHGPHNPKWVAAFMNFMIAVPCLTLAANVVATGLVLWRI